MTVCITLTSIVFFHSCSVSTKEIFDEKL